MARFRRARWLWPARDGPLAGTPTKNTAMPTRKADIASLPHPQDLERDTVTIRNLIPDFVALTGERFLATLGRV